MYREQSGEYRYIHLISNKRQWYNCFNKFSSSVIFAEYFSIFLDKTFGFAVLDMQSISISGEEENEKVRNSSINIHN